MKGKTKRETVRISKYAFGRGWEQLNEVQQKEAKKELAKILGISSEQKWRRRFFGAYEQTFSEGVETLRVFAKYGITDVWGFSEKQIEMENARKADKKRGANS